MLNVTADIHFMVGPESPARPILFRVKHDREMGALWRGGLPEVFPMFPNHFVPFTEAWQRRSFAMNTMDKNKWTSLYTDTIAFTNNQGFGKSGDPRANFITGENLNSPLPKCEALVCGGAVITGIVSGNNLIVHMLDGRKPPPVVIEPWERFHAVTVDGRGVPRMFPQGDSDPVLIPLLADPSRYPIITFPLSKLRKLREDEIIPDPYS